MFSIPRFSIKRPVCVFICVLSLIVFGTSSVFQMPLESTPEIEMPVLMIMTPYYGASPEEIDKSVTDRIEVALSTISEVDSTTSMSSENMGITVLQFDYGVDIDKKYQDVTSALAMLQLPDDAQDPTIIEMNMSAMNSSIMSLSVEANAGDNLKNYVEDNIVPELERIEGVSDVSVFGGSRQYIQVLLDENKMTQYGLTMQAVSSAIASSEFELTMGSLDRGNITVDLTGSQKIENYRTLDTVPITLSGGDVIHLSDVAQVIMADEEQTSYSRRNGLDAISLSVTKEQSGNTVGICQQIVKEVDRLNNSGLGITLEVSYNSGEEIMENIKQVVLSLVEGLAIAVVVLWLFLGEWKASAIVAISMPLSVLTALILMSFLGMTINMMSLGGLVIGIGMLVDNSIVVIDSCFKSTRDMGGTSFREKVIKGAELVTSSVIASTLTTVVVFLPIAMIKGISGQMFHDVAYTIVFSLTASLISAVTLVPLLFVQLQPREKTEFIAYRVMGRVEEWYGAIITRLLHKRKLVVSSAVLLLVLAVVLFAMVPQELMPSMTSGNINLEVTTKSGLNLESTNEIMAQLEDLVKEHPDVENYSMSVGSGGGMMGASAASISVELREDASLSDDEFVQEIRGKAKSIPNCSVEVSANDMMSMLSSQNVDITLQGPDLTVLEKTANQLRDLMAAMPEFDSATTSLANGAPRAEIVVDPILAASVRMTPITVLSSVRSQLTGIEAMTIQDGETEYSVKVELPKDRFVDISDLYGMMIDTPTGGQAALTDMAEIVYTEAPTSITRQDGDYQVTVTGTPLMGSNVSQLTAKVLQAVGSQVELPSGVEVAQGNMMDMMYEEFALIWNALLVALYLVFAVMAIQFESLRFPIVVLISIPFAMVGSFLGLAVTGSSVNMTSLLGLVMLEGIVVNNAIVLIDYVNILRRENGVEIHEALIRAGKMRLRPILMSSLTTIVGLLPMAIGSGVEMMESMAIVVIGGLIMSTLLTLILIPTFYLIFDKEDRRRRKEERRARRQARKEAKAAKQPH
ncbi:MAG: efflux RND transporter permease subunit [Angelakisella sp.]|jgi:multidrug efflux pump subunit AcrB|nr:efflux RND transporter permease subunit [Angelakisella sp.]